MAALITIAALLVAAAAAAWIHAIRKPPPDPQIEARIEARAVEARAARARTEELARRLRVDRAANHYGARLQAAYRGERR